MPKSYPQAMDQAIGKNESFTDRLRARQASNANANANATAAAAAAALQASKAPPVQPTVSPGGLPKVE